MQALDARWGRSFEFDAIYETWDEYLPDSPGVYLLMRGSVLARLDGDDRAGILYIGKTKNLRNRLWAFWCGGTHTAGSYLYSNPDIATRVLGTRCVGMKVVETAMGRLRARIAYPVRRDRLDRAEQAVLGAYVRRYGELPPLNFSLPGKYSGRPSMADLMWASRGLR